MAGQGAGGSDEARSKHASRSAGKLSRVRHALLRAFACGQVPAPQPSQQEEEHGQQQVQVAGAGCHHHTSQPGSCAMQAEDSSSSKASVISWKQERDGLQLACHAAHVQAHCSSTQQQAACEQPAGGPKPPASTVTSTLLASQASIKCQVMAPMATSTNNQLAPLSLPDTRRYSPGASTAPQLNLRQADAYSRPANAQLYGLPDALMRSVSSSGLPDSTPPPMAPRPAEFSSPQNTKRVLSGSSAKHASMLAQPRLQPSRAAVIVPRTSSAIVSGSSGATAVKQQMLLRKLPSADQLLSSGVDGSRGLMIIGLQDSGGCADAGKPQCTSACSDASPEGDNSAHESPPAPHKQQQQQQVRLRQLRSDPQEESGPEGPHWLHGPSEERTAQQVATAAGAPFQRSRPPSRSSSWVAAAAMTQQSSSSGPSFTELQRPHIPQQQQQQQAQPAFAATTQAEQEQAVDPASSRASSREAGAQDVAQGFNFELLLGKKGTSAASTDVVGARAQAAWPSVPASSLRPWSGNKTTGAASGPLCPKRCTGDNLPKLSQVDVHDDERSAALPSPKLHMACEQAHSSGHIRVVPNGYSTSGSGSGPLHPPRSAGVPAHVTNGSPQQHGNAAAAVAARATSGAFSSSANSRNSLGSSAVSNAAPSHGQVIFSNEHISSSSQHEGGPAGGSACAAAAPSPLVPPCGAAASSPVVQPCLTRHPSIPRGPHVPASHPLRPHALLALASDAANRNLASAMTAQPLPVRGSFVPLAHSAGCPPASPVASSAWGVSAAAATAARAASAATAPAAPGVVQRMAAIGTVPGFPLSPAAAVVAGWQSAQGPMLMNPGSLDNEPLSQALPYRGGTPQGSPGKQLEECMHHLAAASAPIPRLTYHHAASMKRSLKVSSQQLQEAVKAMLSEQQQQQQQRRNAAMPVPAPRTPTPSSTLPTVQTLDAELPVLNVSKLESELFGLVLIGRGGGGAVFRAIWQGAQVAVKFMLGKTPASVSLGALEAVLAASVNHPHVVQTYGFDVSKVKESSFTVPQHPTDMLGGGSLQQQFMLPHSPPPGSHVGSQVVASIMRELQWEKARMQALMVGATTSGMNSINGNSNSSNLAVGGMVVTSSASEQIAAAAPTTSAAPSTNTSAGGVPGSPTQQQQQMAVARHLAEAYSSFHSDEGFGEPLEVKPLDCWSMRDVLGALKAQPGMYLTHIIMEYCDRGTLLGALQRGVFSVGGSSGDTSRFNERVVLRAALRTARDVVHGMQHLHTSGIIHGDLKPGNVLLRGSRTDRRGFVAKVADFGLSKVVTNECPLEMHHWSTVTHMAPEVVHGTWCKQSDVYSFGVLLWQLICGEPQPFKHLTVPQVVSGVSQGWLQLPWPRNCHPAVARLGLACMAHNPAMRPNFQEIAQVLLQIEQNMRDELRYSMPHLMSHQQQQPPQQHNSTSLSARSSCGVPITSP